MQELSFGSLMFDQSLPITMDFRRFAIKMIKRGDFLTDLAMTKWVYNFGGGGKISFSQMVFRQTTWNKNPQVIASVLSYLIIWRLWWSCPETPIKHHQPFDLLRGEADGNAGLRDLLGNKGGNLAEMASIGLPVPPGYTLTTEAPGLHGFGQDVGSVASACSAASRKHKFGLQNQPSLHEFAVRTLAKRLFRFPCRWRPGMCTLCTDWLLSGGAERTDAEVPGTCWVWGSVWDLWVCWIGFSCCEKQKSFAFWCHEVASGSQIRRCSEPTVGVCAFWSCGQYAWYDGNGFKCWSERQDRRGWVLPNVAKLPEQPHQVFETPVFFKVFYGLPATTGHCVFALVAKTSGQWGSSEAVRRSSFCLRQLPALHPDVRRHRAGPRLGSLREETAAS